MGLKNTYQAKKRFTKTPVKSTGMWYQDGDVIVPSNQITMKGPQGQSDYFNSPILGVGMQSGETQIMQPGREYLFPNDASVFETKMQNGGWLDQYQEGGQKLTQEKIKDLKNEGVYIGGNNKSGQWGEKRLDRKNPNIIKALSAEPTLEEVKSIIESVPGYNRGYESFYDADPKKIGVQEGPLTENRFSEISNYATDKELIDRYKNQSFGTLPMFEYTGVYEGYSPQRTWVGNKPYLGYSVSERKNINKSKKDPLSTNPRYLYFISPNKDNQRFKDVSDSYTWTDEIFPSVWSDAKKAARSIINNPEITEYLKSKGLTSEELSKTTKAYYDEDGIPMTSQLGEALITNRILNNENAWVRPATNDTSIVIQDRNKFNLAGYLPVTAGMEDSWNEKKEDYFRQQGIPESEWPYVTIHTSPFPIQEYKSSNPNTTSNRTNPKRPPFMYQQGGLFPVGPYDEMMAPKQGNYLLPDINRPYYIDDEGGRRSEYRTGINIDGKETLLPTVVGGRQLTDEQAEDQYMRTGLNMGKFNNVEDADYASRLRTARYNMFADPIRFNQNQFKKGGLQQSYKKTKRFK